MAAASTAPAAAKEDGAESTLIESLANLTSSSAEPVYVNYRHAVVVAAAAAAAAAGALTTPATGAPDLLQNLPAQLSTNAAHHKSKYVFFSSSFFFFFSWVFLSFPEFFWGFPGFFSEIFWDSASDHACQPVCGTGIPNRFG